MFSLWIQRADFQSRQWAVASASDAVAAFERHDWAAELRYLSQLTEQGAETCPPGLGVEADGERRILHVCPLDEMLATVHYHHQGWRRLLGLVPVAHDVVATLEGTSLREVPGLIERFCSGEHAWLERRFAAGRAPSARRASRGAV